MVAFFRRNAFIFLILGFVFLLYGNTLWHGYAFDDYLFVVGNEHLDEGLSGIAYFFKNIYVADESINQIYRPVVFSSYVVERTLFGKSPFVLHFFNVFWYGVLCCVLWQVLCLLMDGWGGGRVLAMLSVVLFIAHPVHTEVVANIKSRDEIYSLLGCLCSAFFLIKYLKKTNKIYLSAAIFCLLLGLLSKFNAVTFLVNGLLFVWHERDGLGSIRPLVLRMSKLALLLLIVIWTYKGSHKFIKQVQFDTENDKKVYKTMLGNSLTDPSLTGSQQIATALGLAPRYLQMLTLAYPLPYYSGYPYVSALGWHSPLAWLGLLLYIGLSLGGVYLFFRHRKLNLGLSYFAGFGMLWLLISLSVYSNLVKLAPDTFAVRYLFSPSVGWSILLVSALAWLTRADLGERHRFFYKNALFFCLFSLMGVFYAGSTVIRNRAWKNSATLFASDMPVLENCARAHTYMASELFRQYLSDGAFQVNRKAELERNIDRHYQRAIELFPIYAEAYLLYARALSSFGKAEQALQVCEMAQKNCPDDKLSTSMCSGEVHYIAERFAQAIPYLETTLNEKKKLRKVHDILAWAYYKNQQADKAHTLLDSAMSRFPNDAYFVREQGKMYFLDKQMQQALPYLKQAYALNATDAQTLHMLANVYAEVGDTLAAKRFAKAFNGIDR